MLRTLRAGDALPVPTAPNKAERTRREQAYEAIAAYGLGEIIDKADVVQRTAMQLPYNRHVVLEGPPGSGKSSVGLMRVAVLINEQFDVLDTDRSDVAAWRYTTGKTRVLVRHEPMVPYLARGLTELNVHGVRTETLASFLTREPADSWPAACGETRRLSPDSRRCRRRSASFGRPSGVRPRRT